MHHSLHATCCKDISFTVLFYPFSSFISSDKLLLDSLSKVWNRFYSETLPTLRAIFYPIQVNIRLVMLLKRRMRASVASLAEV